MKASRINFIKDYLENPPQFRRGDKVGSPYTRFYSASLYADLQVYAMLKFSNKYYVQN